MPCVWLSVSVHDQLVHGAKHARPNETGGVLAGYHGAHDTIVITDVVGPGPNAIHGNDYFVPDHQFHRDEIARIYAASGRINAYLGDWHSHPDGGTDISKTDRRTLRRIATSPLARIAQPLMLIISGGQPWTITIHHAARTRWRIRFAQLELCERYS